MNIIRVYISNLNYNLMNFNKIWKTSALVAAFLLPTTVYSMKAREK